MAIKISSLIAPNFYDLWLKVKDVISNKKPQYTEFWLNGGRGSTKSSFISIAIVLLIILVPDIHAVILRKVKDTLRTSVYNQMQWAINILGLNGYFRFTKSPLEIVYIPTGQTIYFFGLDDAGKVKGIKTAFGYTAITWFEELDQFDGMEELRNVWQSTERGGSKFWRFCSYNPPITQSVWVNQEAATPKDNRYVHKSDYLTVPQGWLTEAFIKEAEHLKSVNERAYRHEYLGEVTGTGGTVFSNVKAVSLTDKEISEFDQIRQGIDWGFAIDPFAFVQGNYSRKLRTLWIFGELYSTDWTNPKAIEKVRQIAIPRKYIFADSAEPKSINEFQNAGLKVLGAKKGPDSVEYGTKFLQSLDNIYIDPKRAPNTYREFTLYEFEKNKDGSFKNKYPDKNNHSIDAVRYMLNDDMIFAGTRYKK